MAFHKKTEPNIREHILYNTNRIAVVTMDKYLLIKKTGKGSGHNEKVNKCKTLVENYTQFEGKHPTAATDSSVKVASRFLIVAAGF